jgi:ATP-dependent RNA helicase RhlE
MPDVKRILAYCPSNRQTMLFSATVPPQLETLCRWALRNPEIIEIGRRRSPAETVTHACYPVAEPQKFDLLVALLARTNFDSCIVFTSTKVKADEIANRLQREGHSVAALHSNRSQREREDAMSGFRQGKYEVMVATDIAARGLDIDQVSHVINYDVPSHAEDYVHRIGRTGRASNTGDAFTIMTASDLRAITHIEAFIGASIPRLKLEGFDYIYTALIDPEVQKREEQTKRRGSGRFSRR